MAIFQNSTSPSFAIICRMKSASPTETPPVVMIASADEAFLNAASSFAGSSRTTPRSMISTPRRESMPCTV